jgi:hypothetical protein
VQVDHDPRRIGEHHLAHASVRVASAMCARALVPASTFTPRTSPIARSYARARRGVDRDLSSGAASVPPRSTW